MRQQITGLAALKERMSTEATNLTRALKGDNKKQGNWGEIILESILEKSGLEKGESILYNNHYIMMTIDDSSLMYQAQFLYHCNQSKKHLINDNRRPKIPSR